MVMTAELTAKTGLNPLIIREELQLISEYVGSDTIKSLNPLIIREELQQW